ncbi:LysM peptidoglycan-binding domain-containing protein [Clostridium botulinum]|nr:LysM peptidoglycan-binding domain-containing protein [Clostridium botulinum]
MDGRRAVWIKSLNENVGIQLPITPLITFKESMATSSQDLLGFGEIENGSTTKLDTWTCESFFPDINNDYDFLISKTKYDTSYYVEVFRRWMKEQHTLEFEYYSDAKTINKYNCKIVGFSHGEKNGNKNVYYTLDFREYKELKVYQQSIVNSEYIANSYGSPYYYVGEGDTLINIAAKLYGDSSKWDYLLRINGLKNPLDITLGQQLKI